MSAAPPIEGIAEREQGRTAVAAAGGGEAIAGSQSRIDTVPSAITFSGSRMRHLRKLAGAILALP